MQLLMEISNFKVQKQDGSTSMRMNTSAINPLQPGVAFLYLLKTSENLKVFWCFQGV